MAAVIALCTVNRSRCRNCFAKTRDGIRFGDGADEFRIALCSPCRAAMAEVLAGAISEPERTA